MGFFKSLLGAALNGASAIGQVTGGEYNRYTVNLVKNKDGEQVLKFAMLSKPDILISKADVREFATLESGAQWIQGSGSGAKRCLGNRYKLITKDGKSAIFNVLANYTGQIESLFLL